MRHNTLDQPATSKESINQACNWLARLWADDVTEKDHAACLAWRQSAPENEYAWQQVQKLQQRFRVVPDPKVGSKLLRQTQSISRRQFLTYVSVTAGAGLLATEHFRTNRFTQLTMPPTKAKSRKQFWLTARGCSSTHQPESTSILISKNAKYACMRVKSILKQRRITYRYQSSHERVLCAHWVHVFR